MLSVNVNLAGTRPASHSQADGATRGAELRGEGIVPAALRIGGGCAGFVGVAGTAGAQSV